jgi:hypothetical protein
VTSGLRAQREPGEEHAGDAESKPEEAYLSEQESQSDYDKESEDRRFAQDAGQPGSQVHRSRHSDRIDVAGIRADRRG